MYSLYPNVKLYSKSTLVFRFGIVGGIVLGLPTTRKMSYRTESHRVLGTVRLLTDKRRPRSEYRDVMT